MPGKDKIFPAYFFICSPLLSPLNNRLLNPLYHLIKLLAKLLHLVAVGEQHDAPREIRTVTPRPVSNPASFSQSPLRCRLGLCE